jgi:hypothetical protein
MKMNVEGKRGSPIKKWLDTIENDIRAVGVCVGNVENQDEWMLKTKVTNFKYE